MRLSHRAEVRAWKGVPMGMSGDHTASARRFDIPGPQAVGSWHAVTSTVPRCRRDPLLPLRAALSREPLRERERSDGLKPQQVLQYLELPLRRPFAVLLPLVLVTAAALGASYLVPRRYQSSTLVMVESEKIPDSFVAKSVETPRRLETVRQEVLSRTRLERILQELHPYPESAGTVALTLLVERMRDATQVTVKGDDAFTIAYTHHDPRKAMEV